MLYIGGCSMTGKSSTARILSGRTGMPSISTDDIVAACQSRANVNYIRNYRFDDYYIHATDEQMISDMLALHANIKREIFSLSDFHLRSGDNVIIEGSALYPDYSGDIKGFLSDSIWLAVSNEEVLKRRFMQSWIFSTVREQHEKVADKYVYQQSWLNSYLIKRCRTLGLDVIYTDKMSLDEIADKIFEKRKRTSIVVA